MARFKEVWKDFYGNVYNIKQTTNGEYRLVVYSWTKLKMVDCYQGKRYATYEGARRALGRFCGGYGYEKVKKIV